MDDLYGDLPPASGEEKRDTTGLIGSAWSSLPLSQKQPKEKPTGTPQVTAAAASVTAAKSTKFVPSSLLFKPRQTSVAPSSNSSSSTAVSAAPQTSRNRALSVDNSTAIPQPAVVPTVIHEEPKEVAVEVYAAAAVEEFNNNSSFEVGEAYDPRRPNDYLAYCKERDEAKRLEKLAGENRRRLEEMEQARMELERQRKEAAERKDYKTLATASISAGESRGRGRGLSNLPSWVVQQMKEEEEKEKVQEGRVDAAPTSSHQPVVEGQFQDAVLPPPFAASSSSSSSSNSNGSNIEMIPVGTKRKVTHFSKPSNVILLKNMVAVEDVDDSLSFETKMECQKYGSVKTCRILVVDQKRFPKCPPQELVRTFVHFDRQDSAVRALK
jgi:hypothetical protein